MCSYSMVHDWAMKLPPQVWDRPLLSQYEDMIRRLKAIDDKLNLPDCDPNKGQFLDDIRRRVEDLEKRVGIKP
jgi:archaellum component FlaC